MRCGYVYHFLGVMWYDMAKICGGSVEYIPPYYTSISASSRYSGGCAYIVGKI